MSIPEIIMMICFGLAWPASIYKSWTSKKTQGKSIGFLFIILLGYIAGVVHKILYSFDAVITLYIVNAVMVITDVILFYRNRMFEKKEEGLQQKKTPLLA